MAIHPNFPVLESDQADVIQIFLNLMIERERDGLAPEATANEPAGTCNESNDTWFPGELSDRGEHGNTGRGA